MTSLEKAVKMAKILDDKLGTDIKVLKVEDLTSICDYFVIATGNSTTHVKALADEVEYKLKNEDKVIAVRTEGYNSLQWILTDYSDVVCHVFIKDAREFYSLDRLWKDATEIPLDFLEK